MVQVRDCVSVPSGDCVRERVLASDGSCRVTDMEEEADTEEETDRVTLGEPLGERAALSELYCEGVQVALTVTVLLADCERVGDSVAQAECEPERVREVLSVCVNDGASPCRWRRRTAWRTWWV